MKRSPHSNVIKGKKQKAKFVKHLPFEQATTLSEAKYLASDRSENYRYAYRAKALLTGNAAVKPGELVYLAGLAHGMSGYWTVLSVTHLFGSGNAKYQLEVVLGADVIGQEDPISTGAYERNFEAELSEQSLVSFDSALISYSLSPTEGTVEDYQTYSSGIKNVQPAYKTTSDDLNPYKEEVPDFSSVKLTDFWRAI